MRHILTSFFSSREAKQLFKLGIPVYVAQLSGMGMSFVDTVMTGQASTIDMAAVAVASSLWHPISLFGIGVLVTLTPLSAQLVGEGKGEQTPRLLRQGMWCSLLMALPLMALLYFLSWHMGRLGLEADLADLSGGYLRAILWGLPAFFLFANVRSFFEGFSRTRPAMVISIAALLLNVPLNYVLIYGVFGFPAMGAVGCGVATAICFWFMAVCMLFYGRYDTRKRNFNNGKLFAPILKEGIDWKLLRRIMRIGLPSALAMLFELTLFSAAALVLAPLGTIVVAGHQVALNVAGMLFILPLSISMTAAIRVGHCLGAGQWTHARITAWTALCVGTFCSAVASLGLILFREQVAFLYTQDAHVITLASTLLIYAAAFQLIDTLQVVSIGVLRGYNDTKIISYVCFIAYWIIGFPLGFVLSRTDFLGASESYGTSYGPEGYWTAFIVALLFGTVCYLYRIVTLQRLDSDVLRQKIAA